MFSKALEWNYIRETMLNEIRRVKQYRLNNQRLRYLETAEECERLIAACAEHLKPIVIIALNTGMRKEDILALRWSNVDMVNGIIKLVKTKSYKRRQIPINATRRETLFGLPRSGSEYVFTYYRSGTRLMTIRHSFELAVQCAKIKDFTFHDLQHTIASHLVMAGVDLTTVKELLGHSTITMTMRYAHLAHAH